MTKDQQIRQYAEQLNKMAFELVTLLNDIDIEVQERRNLIHIMAPKRKKPKEGHIRERSDGRFEGRYMQDGKPHSVYAKTYNDCLKKLEAAIERRDNRPADIALLAWLNEYVDVYKKGEVGTETYKAMVRNIRLHIAPSVSDLLKLVDVRPIDLQRILKAVASDRVREDVYNLLSGALRQAVAERFITYNPMLAVKRVKAKREKGIALTVGEQSAFLRAIAGSKLELYYRFVLCSGCRRNEALDVRREDIDEEKRLVHIRGTKTEGSDRFIPLFAGIRDLLPLLPSFGTLFDFKPDYVSKQFKKYCSDHVLHDLRHTFATRALEVGVPIKVVQVWLGHSELFTTADIYSDVSREFSLSEANKLDGIFEPDN